MNVALLALALASATQNPPPQKDIDRAIDKGCEFLQKHVDEYLKDYGWAGHGNQSDAVLVLYTLVKGHADDRHPGFRKALAFCLQHPIESTYFPSVLAMALEAHDKRKYFGKIGQCGYFLVATQCKNGQWGYGHEVRLPTPTRSPRLKFGKGGSTVVKTRIPVAPGGEAAKGDNSNTQYGLLGLRSCEEAGWEAPKETWERALKWWKGSQRGDGGWNYGTNGGEGSYLGMTEGGMGSTVLCLFYTGQHWQGDDSIRRAKEYIGKNFSLENNYVPRERQQSWQYYHLYAMERGGSLAFTESFGGHYWYAEGAKYLLERQKEDGRWDAPSGNKRTVWDTCFAVLFLARATRPVASTDNGR